MPDLDPLTRLRAVYCLARRQFEQTRTGRPSDYGARPMAKWDGGRDADDRHHRPFWPKLAAFCAANELDPEALVAAVFDAADGGEAPLPTHLTSRRALDAYRQYGKSAAEALALAYQVELRIYDSYVRSARLAGATVRQAERDVLNDPDVGVTDLFRHCRAAALGLATTAARFRAGALAQYAFRRALYDQVLGDLVPAALRAAGAAFYESLTYTNGKGGRRGRPRP